MRLTPLIVFGFALLGADLSAAASANVRVNSVGYIDSQPKRATVLTAAGNNAFNVRRASDNASVFAGTLGNAFTNTDTGQSVRFADFNSVTAPGTYYLDVTGVGTSVNFAIGDDVFNQAVWVAVMGFYNQRCGMAHSMTYNGDTWGHGACHLGDGNQQYYNGGGVKNGTGGWHDAGDFGKYIVNAGITTGQMLQAWELYSANLSQMTLPHGSNATLPDYLEELKWEMDWVLKMQFPDGRVSHKLTRTGFEPYPLMPPADAGTRYFVPWGSAATASFVAMCAKAYRAFLPYDAAYAATLMSAATLSYNYLVANPADVAPDQSCCTTGGYGSGDSDDRLWAAVEMWESTGAAAQLTDAETRINAHGADKSDFNWDWGDVSNLGMYTYVLSSRAGRNATTLADVRADIVADANTMVTNTNAHGYGRALNQYYWGANGTVVRQAHHLDIANRITPTPAFLDAAGQQLAWTFSRNYFNRSQVTGLGLNPPMNPHDRESSGDAVTAPKPGHLVGGGHPGATDWDDTASNYAENEIAINWDGALTYALAMWYRPPVTNTPTHTPSRTPSPSVTPTYTPLPCGVPTNIRRVNVGGTAFTDASSSLWDADQLYVVGGWGYVTAGTVAVATDPITNTTDDLMYQDQRWAPTLTYRFTVANGPYTVRVKLAETYWTATNQRLFNVSAEGATVLSGVDLFALAPGQDRAYDVNFGTAVSDGVLDLVFTATTDNVSIAAIQVESAVSGPCATNTFTPTGTRSPTGTWSVTGSPTRTATVTASLTASATLTQTGTPTFSSTVSATPSRTATSTPTRSVSPSASPSFTASPLASDTVSPTISATSTRTPTASPSSSRTATATVTSSFTASPLASDTVSPTISATSTATRTATASPTATRTATATATPSVTLTVTPTFSASPLASDTVSPTVTSTDSASPSSTRTVSSTPSATWTATLTSTPSYSAGPSATSTATPTTGSVAPPASDGPLHVLKAVLHPHPVRGPRINLRFHLDGPADTVTLKVYSRAMVVVAVLSAQGSYQSGWNQADLLAPDLGAGSWFATVHAKQGAKQSLRAAPLRLFKLP